MSTTFQWVRTTVLPNLTGVVAGVSGMVVGVPKGSQTGGIPQNLGAQDIAIELLQHKDKNCKIDRLDGADQQNQSVSYRGSISVLGRGVFMSFKSLILPFRKCP